MKKHTAGPDGWSKWVNPKRKGYRLACCDCGLVHDMDFDVVQFKSSTSGEVKRTLTGKTYGVLFRARRNNRSTAALRRGMRAASSHVSEPDNKGKPEGIE